MRCFDCKFPVMLMFFCISRIYLIYTLYSSEARGRGCLFAAARSDPGTFWDPSTVCFF